MRQACRQTSLGPGVLFCIGLVGIGTVLFAPPVRSAEPPAARPESAKPTEAGAASRFRGMYVSLWTDRVGRVRFTGEDACYARLLGDADKERRLLEFVREQRIDALSLYDLRAILTDDGRTSALASFVRRAREAGIRHVEAIGAEDRADWDRIRRFHREQVPFDGLLTEMEFWTGTPSFEEFLATLRYVRSLDWTPAGGEKSLPRLSAYLGRLNARQAEQMAPLVDRVYIHVYVPSGDRTFAYGAERFRLFAACNERLKTHVEAVPIYSAEGKQFAAGPEHFQGEWLQDHGLDESERRFTAEWNRALGKQPLRLAGHQYYEYCFLDRYLRPPPRSRPSAEPFRPVK